MSQKYVQLFDDSVIKFTAKLGTEEERVGGLNNPNDLINVSVTETLPGSFDTGEIVYTRDTNRLFVGNFSSKLNELGLQLTLGGTLTGNKYLGYIDSKPLINFQSSAGDNGVPLPLTIDKQVEGTTEKALLKEDSRYRSYEIVDENGICIKTPDKKWARNSYYNADYDAYDGDFAYDIYRNAFILFDHNIKPSVSESGLLIDGEPTPKTPKNGKKRKTPITPWDGGDENVKAYTRDMYGEGYVLFYNVIPDGDTLGFVEKSFDLSTGLSNNTEKKGNNYSYNLLKIKRVPTIAIKACFDNAQFDVSGDTVKLRSLNADQIKVAGSAQTIINDKVAANRVLVTDGDSFCRASGISTTELNQLSGIGSLKNIGNTSVTIKEKFEEIDRRLNAFGILSEDDLNNLFDRIGKLEEDIVNIRGKVEDARTLAINAISWPSFNVNDSATIQNGGAAPWDCLVVASYQSSYGAHVQLRIDGVLVGSSGCGDKDGNAHTHSTCAFAKKGQVISGIQGSTFTAYKLTSSLLN